MTETRPTRRRRIRKPRGAYHHGDLRRALVDAALVSIERDGPQSLSLREVARAAGVSTAAPYRHFASREALLAGVATEGFHMLSAAMDRAVADHADPLERLRASGVAYVEFAAAHPAHYRVMFTGGLVDRDAYPDCRAAAETSFGYLLSAIRACQSAGLIRDDDPMKLALAAWSAVHGLASLVCGGQLPLLRLDVTDPAALAAYVGDILLAGVRD